MVLKMAALGLGFRPPADPTIDPETVVRVCIPNQLISTVSASSCRGFAGTTTPFGCMRPKYTAGVHIIGVSSEARREEPLVRKLKSTDQIYRVLRSTYVGPSPAGLGYIGWFSSLRQANRTKRQSHKETIAQQDSCTARHKKKVAQQNI